VRRHERTIIDTRSILVAVSEIVREDLIDKGKVLLGIIDKDGSIHHCTLNALAELTLATTTDSARLVDKDTSSISSDDVISGRSRMVNSLITETVRKDISLSRDKTDALLVCLVASLTVPSDCVGEKAKEGILRDVADVGETLIDSITLRHHCVVLFSQKSKGIMELVATEMREKLCFCKSISDNTIGITRESQCASRVLFLSISHEVCCIRKLCLDLLLAITKVVICNDAEDNTLLGTIKYLERLSVVILFALVLPAHALFSLLFSGILPTRKTKLLLGDIIEMRSHDDETSVTSPVFRIKASIVLGKERISGIAENAFDEIEARDKRAGSQAKDFHCADRALSWDFRADDGTKEKRDHGMDFRKRRRLCAVGEERREFWRMKSDFQHTDKDILWNSQLIARDDKVFSTLTDVESSSSCSLVETRVVENTTVLDLVALHIRVLVLISTERERELTSNTVFAENDGL